LRAAPRALVGRGRERTDLVSARQHDTGLTGCPWRRWQMLVRVAAEAAVRVTRVIHFMVNMVMRVRVSATASRRLRPLISRRPTFGAGREVRMQTSRERRVRKGSRVAVSESGGGCRCIWACGGHRPRAEAGAGVPAGVDDAGRASFGFIFSLFLSARRASNMLGKRRFVAWVFVPARSKALAHFSDFAVASQSGGEVGGRGQRGRRHGARVEKRAEIGTLPVAALECA
jgi:hypothetical protein